MTKLGKTQGYMGTREAMRYLGILDPNTIYHYISEGKLKAHKLGGEGGRRHWRFLKTELDEFMAGAKTDA